MLGEVCFGLWRNVPFLWKLRRITIIRPQMSLDPSLATSILGRHSRRSVQNIGFYLFCIWNGGTVFVVEEQEREGAHLSCKHQSGHAADSWQRGHRLNKQSDPEIVANTLAGVSEARPPLGGRKWASLSRRGSQRAAAPALAAGERCSSPC